MEEILASIRRIIADDDATKGQPRPADPLPPPPTPVAQPPRPAVDPQPPPPPPAAPSLAPLAAEPANHSGAMLAEPETTPDPDPAATELPDSDVFDLTEAMTVPEVPRAEGFRTIDGQSDVFFDDSPAEPEAPPAMEVPPRPFQDSEQALISATTSAVVDSAFNTLAHTVLVQNARTLEDLVREMLRPLLKTWLDDNLPGLVERLVRAEIERVSRGRS